MKPFNQVLECIDMEETRIRTHQNKVVLADSSKKATEIHGNFSMALNSLIIAGWISATIVVSSPKRNVDVSTELMIRTHLKPWIWRPPPPPSSACEI